MRSIAFFNNKGGVGKTTLLCNVAAYLAIEMGKNVLVVDADPQCNATPQPSPHFSHDRERLIERSVLIQILSLIHI